MSLLRRSAASFVLETRSESLICAQFLPFVALILHTRTRCDAATWWTEKKCGLEQRLGVATPFVISEAKVKSFSYCSIMSLYLSGEVRLYFFFSFDNPEIILVCLSISPIILLMLIQISSFCIVR